MGDQSTNDPVDERRVCRLAAALQAARFPKALPPDSAPKLWFNDVRGEIDEERPLSNELGCGDRVDLLQDGGYFVKRGDWEEYADEAPLENCICIRHATARLTAGQSSLDDDERLESLLRRLDKDLAVPVLDGALESERIRRDQPVTRDPPHAG